MPTPRARTAPSQSAAPPRDPPRTGLPARQHAITNAVNRCAALHAGGALTAADAWTHYANHLCRHLPADEALQ